MQACKAPPGVLAVLRAIVCLLLVLGLFSSARAHAQCVAFSATGVDHTSTGNPDLLYYGAVQVDTAGAFDGITFSAPVDGVYFFCITLVRNPYLPFGQNDEDTFMQLMHNGALVGEAWAGESSSHARESATYAVLLHASAGDTFHTRSRSDGDVYRHLAKYEFNGFLKCVDENPNCIAFSASGTNHTSTGNPDVLSYSSEQVDTAGAFDGITFQAPVDGTYVFIVSLVRNPYPPLGQNNEDTYVQLLRNGTVLGEAWAGESSGNARASATYSIVVDVTAGDTFHTRSRSDGDVYRHLAKFEFAGFQYCESQNPACAAFSAQGYDHTSTGNPDVLLFSLEQLDSAGTFDGITFAAPVDGVYFFCISLVRNPYNPLGQNNEDTFMQLLHNGAVIGEAWAGESAGNARRSATLTVLLQANAGDTFHTRSRSDGDVYRHLAKYEFSGFLVCTGTGQTVGTPVCFGDGTGTACPCLNNGTVGHGCANGTGDGGILSASGTASVSADTLTLTADAVINNNGLFFQGNNTVGGGTGSVFGDGIRCCGGGVVRIQVVNPPGSTSPATAQMTETATTNGPVGTITAGTKKCYQYWYRDPASSPCGSQFNLTNAVSVTWGP